MSERQGPRVAIAGGGALGQALAQRLADRFAVRITTFVGESRSLDTAVGVAPVQADLTSIPDAEIALAGAETVVFLAQAARPPARLTQATRLDLEALLADTVGRAARRTGAKRLIFYACGQHDPREALLAQSGVPLSVLSGTGPEASGVLAELVEAPPGTRRELSSKAGASLDEFARDEHRPDQQVCSVNRYEVPGRWTAERVAQVYFEWLPSSAPLTKVERVGDTYIISTAGQAVLVLEKVPGRSEPDSCVLRVVGGATVESPPNGRFEFRRLGTGPQAMAILTGFRPALPWPVYRVSQAVAHAKVMRSFGERLAQGV